MIPGDGVGPEVLKEGMKVLKQAAECSGAFSFEDTWFPWGCGYYLEHGQMMPGDGIRKMCIRDRDMALIFTAEYVTGRLLRSLRACPWDYTGCRFSVDGLIRLDFAPLWFGAGLLFERITQGKDPVNPA